MLGPILRVGLIIGGNTVSTCLQKKLDILLTTDNCKKLFLTKLKIYSATGRIATHIRMYEGMAV